MCYSIFESDNKKVEKIREVLPTCMVQNPERNEVGQMFFTFSGFETAILKLQGKKLQIW